MRKFLSVSLCGFVLSSSGIAAANNTDDGFIWIDANTRIKVKPVATKPAPDTPAAGATAPEKAPKKEEKKETPRK